MKSLGFWTLALLLGGSVSAPAATPSQALTGPFRDVPPDHWAAQAMETLRRQGIVQGYPAPRPEAPKSKAPKSKVSTPQGSNPKDKSH